MFMWPTPSLSHRFYANEMIMLWRILRFAPKAVHICKTNLFKFTKKETMNIKLQIFEARWNVSMLSARPECVAVGDPSRPPKRVNLWHYWLSDMKRIDESGVVRLWMEMGFCHCEQDPFRGQKMWVCPETEPCSRLNDYLTFPGSPSSPLSNKERQFDTRGELPDPGLQIRLNLALLHPAVATGGEWSRLDPPSTPKTVHTVPTQRENNRLYVTPWNLTVFYFCVFYLCFT